MIVVSCNSLVEKSTENQVYTSSSKIPHNKVGLLLGTGKWIRTGQVNLYYKHRIDATVELYKAGKIEYVLISGDNSHKSYDEPTTMKKDLVKLGIPSSRIFLDYAGFRTLDSIIRCKSIFGESAITVISQPFHNQRALFLANNNEMSAIGFNAKDVSARYGARTRFREKLARVKVMIDVIFGVTPKFLGDKIEIK